MKGWFENLGIKTSLASSKLHYFTPFHNSVILNPWLLTKQRWNHLTSNCFYTKIDNIQPLIDKIHVAKLIFLNMFYKFFMSHVFLASVKFFCTRNFTCYFT